LMMAGFQALKWVSKKSLLSTCFSSNFFGSVNKSLIAERPIRLFHSSAFLFARRVQNKKFQPSNFVNKEQEVEEEPLRVFAHTTANSYKLRELEVAMTRKDDYREKNSWIDEKKDLVLYFKLSSGGEIFYFCDGIVGWNLTDKEEKDRLEHLKEFEVGQQETETEEMEFYHRISGKSDLTNDTFYIVKSNIEEKMPEIEKEKERVREQEDKLMFSYAMVRSTKLNQLEAKVDLAVEGAKHIPSLLASKGKLGLSTTAVNKHIGSLMELKSIINLHSGIREEPDLCWDKPELEQLYLKSAKNFSIQKRVQILNSKLDFVSQIVAVLQTQAYNQHSGFLEIIIIVLIAMEILFEIEDRGFLIGLYIPYKRVEQYLEEKNHKEKEKTLKVNNGPLYRFSCKLTNKICTCYKYKTFTKKPNQRKVIVD